MQFCFKIKQKRFIEMERLKELRLEKGLSQQQLARQIETTQSNIGRWENGINEPSASQLIKLADYFGCTIDFLVGREDDFGVKKDDFNQRVKTKNDATFLRLYDKLGDSAKKITLDLMHSLEKNNV